MAQKRTLNLHRENREDWRGPFLCPFRDAPFPFDERSVRTVEGFVLTLRLPPNDTRRIITLMEDAATARRVAGRLRLKEHVWWNDQEIKVDSEEYERLFERMLRARFRKDRRAIAALMATRGCKLVHERPYPNSPLSVVPIKLYRKALTGLRKELFRTGEIARNAAA